MAHIYSPSLTSQPAAHPLCQPALHCAQTRRAPPSAQTAAPAATHSALASTEPCFHFRDPHPPPERSVTRTQPVLSCTVHTQLPVLQTAISRQHC